MAFATVGSVFERLRYKSAQERYLYVLEMDGHKYGPCTKEEADDAIDRRFLGGMHREYTLTALEALT